MERVNSTALGIEMMSKIVRRAARIAPVIFMPLVILSGCSSESWEVEKTDGVNMDVKPDPEAMIPLEVVVDDADDQWWFYDNFSFVGRVSSIGNLLLVAEIGRCLDPGSDPKVTKTFRCRTFDGTSWRTVGSYSEPDVITEMATISTNPGMDFLWLESHRSGTFKYLSREMGPVIVDFKDMETFYSLSSEGNFKRTYAGGLGRVQFGDSLWEGQMFYEMMNIRGNNRCRGNMPDFNSQNLYRLFAQTSAGKTIIASVDMNNPQDRIGNAFFTILDGATYKTADGIGRIANRNADFRPIQGYRLPLPHHMEIYSGDSINVRLVMWVDKDVWTMSGDGVASTGVFGNALFWNRREKVWGLVDHYQNPQLDTLELVGF
jgi:hypothetical protein